MKRSLIQIYTHESVNAVEFYQKVFSAPLISGYKNGDGTFFHAELDLGGQILAVSQIDEDNHTQAGSTMQFCLEYGEGKQGEVRQVCERLKQDAQKIITPLAPCAYSDLMMDLIDKFGVRWCVFV